MENVVLVKRDDLDALAARLLAHAAPEPDEVLTSEQAAQLLSLSRAQVVALADAGEIPAKNVWPGGVKRSYRFSKKGILEWLKKGSTNG